MLCAFCGELALLICYQLTEWYLAPVLVAERLSRENRHSTLFEVMQRILAVGVCVEVVPVCKQQIELVAFRHIFYYAVDYFKSLLKV